MKNHKKKGARASLTAHQQLEGKNGSQTSPTTQQQSSEEKSCSRMSSTVHQKSAGTRAGSGRLRKKPSAEQQAPKKSILSREAAAMALILGLTLTSQAPLAGYTESFSDQAAYLKPRQEARAKLEKLLRDTDNLSVATMIDDATNTNAQALKDALDALNDLDATNPDKAAIKTAITTFKDALKNRLDDLKIDPNDKSSTLVPLFSFGNDKMKLVLKNIKDFYKRISEAKEKAQTAIGALGDRAAERELTKELQLMAKETLGVMQAVLPAKVAAKIPRLSEYHKMVQVAQSSAKDSSVSTTPPPTTSTTPPPTTSTTPPPTTSTTPPPPPGMPPPPPPPQTSSPGTINFTAAEIIALKNLKAVTGSTTSVNTLTLSELQAMKNVFDTRKDDLIKYVAAAGEFNKQEKAASRTERPFDLQGSDDPSKTISFADVKAVSGLTDINAVNDEIAKLTTAPEFNGGNKLTPDQVTGLGLLKDLVDGGNVDMTIGRYDKTNVENLQAAISVIDACYAYKNAVEAQKTRGVTRDSSIPTHSGQYNFSDLPNKDKYSAISNLSTKLNNKLTAINSATKPAFKNITGLDALSGDQKAAIENINKILAKPADLATLTVDKITTIKKEMQDIKKIQDYKAAVTTWNNKSENSADQVNLTIPLDGSGTFDLTDLPAADLANTELGTGSVKIKFSDALDAAIFVKNGLDVEALTKQDVTDAIAVIDKYYKADSPSDFSAQLLAASQEDIDKIKAVTDVAALTEGILNKYKTQLGTYSDATNDTDGIAKKNDGATFNITAEQIEKLTYVVTEDVRILIPAYAAYLAKREALFTGFDINFQDGAKYPVLTITKADSNHATQDEIMNKLHIAGAINVKMNNANLVPFLFKGPKGDETYDASKVEGRYNQVKNVVDKLNGIIKNQTYKDLMTAQSGTPSPLPEPRNDYKNVVYDADILSNLNAMAEYCDATGQLKTNPFSRKDSAGLEAIKSWSINKPAEIKEIKSGSENSFFTQDFNKDLQTSYPNLNTLLGLEKIKDAAGNDVEGIFKPGKAKMPVLKNLCNVDEFIKKLDEAIATAKAEADAEAKGGDGAPVVDLSKPTVALQKDIGEIKTALSDSSVTTKQKMGLAKAAVKNLTDNLSDPTQVEKAAEVLLAVAETMDADDVKNILSNDKDELTKQKLEFSKQFSSAASKEPNQDKKKQIEDLHFKLFVKPKNITIEQENYKNNGLKASELDDIENIEDLKTKDLDDILASDDMTKLNKLLLKKDITGTENWYKEFSEKNNNLPSSMLEHIKSKVIELAKDKKLTINL